MVKELFFKVVPVSTPIVDIGFKPPIISGLAYILNFYETIFYYWNGTAYINEIDFIEDIRKPNKYYNDNVYAGVDDIFEMAIYNAIAGADVSAGAVTKQYLNYNIIIDNANGGDEIIING